MLFFDALPVLLGQVGQRDKVTRQKAVAIIVIFDVNRPPHAARRLSDKTELAFVGAAPDIHVESGVHKLHSH